MAGISVSLAGGVLLNFWGVGAVALATLATALLVPQVEVKRRPD
jgi:hypothetical protein